MKKAILLLLIFTSAFAHAQSLKDALFSGKLKNEAGTVIRKGDDLSTKLDSNKRAKPDSVQMAATGKDSASSLVKSTEPQLNVKATAANEQAIATDATVATEDTPKTVAPAVKDNTALWNEFMDGFVKTLETDVLPLKKIKPDKYYISLFYAIEKDGTTSITDVLVSPDSKELQDQIKRRLTLETPTLDPVTSSSGAARRVTKKYNFTLTKE